MSTKIQQSTIEEIVEFHGHMCPGLAIGVRAAEAALREVGPHASDEEVVALVETDMCAVDAVQFLTGCTFGKGNLVHKDWGKNAFTFWRRSDGKSVRISTLADVFGAEDDKERRELFAKVREGTATEDETARFHKLHLARSQAILDAPEEAVIAIRPNFNPVPRAARIHRSIVCAQCGEPTMETRIQLLEGKQLCPPCFEQLFSAGSKS
ncbi:MAG: FmdE family protein [Actinobacteria bacterium]|nr:FmdE family protein [Actinomycetota bacterium]